LIVTTYFSLSNSSFTNHPTVFDAIWLSWENIMKYTKNQSVNLRFHTNGEFLHQMNNYLILNDDTLSTIWSLLVVLWRTYFLRYRPYIPEAFAKYNKNFLCPTPQSWSGTIKCSVPCSKHNHIAIKCRQSIPAFTHAYKLKLKYFPWLDNNPKLKTHNICKCNFNKNIAHNQTDKSMKIQYSVIH
jgi:hypothetical protein